MFRLLKSRPKFRSSWRIGTLTMIPRDWSAAFLQATTGRTADGKADRVWTFRGPSGSEFNVYSYKATSVYDSDLPSPAEYWASTEPDDLSIGGDNASVAHLPEFLIWVQTQIANVKGGSK